MTGCDGLPYVLVLGSRLKDTFFNCLDCDREFVCHDEFQEHKKDHQHCQQIPLEECRKYNNIVLIPGM